MWCFGFTLILFTNFRTDEVQLRPGQISPREIRSPVTRVIVDEERTAELKRIAASKVQKVYQEDKEALPRSKRQLQVFLDRTNQIRNNEGLAPEEKRAEIDALLTSVIEEKRVSGLDSRRIAQYIVNASADDMSRIQQQSVKIVNDLMSKPITQEALSSAYEQAAAKAYGLGYGLEAQQFIHLAVVQALQPNMIFNMEATQKAIDEAVGQVLPVQRTIKQNQTIIRAGIGYRRTCRNTAAAGGCRGQDFGMALGE